MTSLNNCYINQQQSDTNTSEIGYENINISKFSSQELDTINSNDLIAKNDISECDLENNNIVQNVKVENGYKIYENDTKSTLFTLENTLTEKITGLKEFEETFDNYKENNTNVSHNLNMKLPLCSLDELNLIDLVINDIQKITNCINAEEESKNVAIKKESIEKDTLNCNTNRYNNNTNIDNIDEINVTNFSIENKSEADNIYINNISQHNSSNINNKININTFDTKNELNSCLPIALINNTNKVSSIIENLSLSKDNSEKNKNLHEIKKSNQLTIPMNINEKDSNKAEIDKTGDVNEKIPSLKTNRQILPECSKYSYMHNTCYRKVLKEPKNENDTIYTIILSSDDEDSNSIENINKFDTISISSDENLDLKAEKNQNIDSDCTGYNSSDFEFIDEDEAKKVNILHNDNVKAIEITKEQDIQDFIIHDYFNMLITSQGEINGNKNNNIPQGADFINLFGGNYTPLPIHCVEKKAVNTGTSMNAGFKGIGFDMRILQANPELEAFRQEAYDCERKILSMYPFENRRKRQRRY